MTAHGGGAVLDIGFGTGTLTARLYAQGCRIYGQDFSERMVQLAQEKMPDAKLYSGDFKQGLVEPLRAQRYDFILATYSLHHLTDAEKVPFLNGLLALLQEDGEILIGDVAFRTRAELEACRDAGRRIVGRGRDLLRGRRAGARPPAAEIYAVFCLRRHFIAAQVMHRTLRILLHADSKRRGP